MPLMGEQPFLSMHCFHKAEHKNLNLSGELQKYIQILASDSLITKVAKRKHVNICFGALYSSTCT
jgi:hypothetical protein